MKRISSDLWVIFKWSCAHLVILMLGLMMAFGVMLLLWTLALLAIYCTWTPSSEVLNLAKLHFGQALYALAPFGVCTVLLNHYPSCTKIVRRSLILGTIGAALLSAAAVIDEAVVYYYTHKTLPICNLPMPTNQCQKRNQ